MRPGLPPRRRRCHRRHGPVRPPHDRILYGTHVRPPRSGGVAFRVSVPAFLLERPNLDREGGRPRKLLAPVERGVEIGSLDDAEPPAALFAVGYGTARREQAAAL